MANSTSGHQKLFIRFPLLVSPKSKLLRSSEPLDFDEFVAQLTPIK